MCAGITSAVTASRFFAANFFIAFEFSWGTAGFLIVALLFTVVLAAVNLRGVGDSIKLNVVLSCIEAIGLLLVIAVGLLAAILIVSGVVLSWATQLFNRRRGHRELPIDDVAPIGAASG